MNVLKRSFVAATAVAASFAAAPAAQAHFQLAYTPDVNLEKSATIPMLLAFWHPMENGHAMDMGQPEEFYYVLKGKKKDLAKALKPVTFHAAHNNAKAFQADVKIKRNGDYIFVLKPAPYYEKSEDIYIQQITKSFVNKGQMPTGWNEPVGLPTEIVPLNKPTNIIAGSTFSGVVLSEGKPVAGAEIEIEYLAAKPDIKKHAATKPTVSPMPGGSIIAVTNKDGEFSFGIPKAGHWGFAALGTGPAKEFKGKELSQDAVIWVEAFDLKK